MLLILYTLLAHILTALLHISYFLRRRTSASKKVAPEYNSNVSAEKKLRGNCKTEVF